MKATFKFLDGSTIEASEAAAKQVSEAAKTANTWDEIAEKKVVTLIDTNGKGRVFPMSSVMYIDFHR
jgi:hypothetical protein